MSFIPFSGGSGGARTDRTAVTPFERSAGTTVDLTELQGENATMLSRFDLPDGTYTGVRLHVTGVNGTLKSGEEVDFVFDATVFEAGKSGKYVLKPVASESGTDVPIREGTRGARGGDLGARFLGPVEHGEAATVKVTGNGAPATACPYRDRSTLSDGSIDGGSVRRRTPELVPSARGYRGLTGGVSSEPTGTDTALSRDPRGDRQVTRRGGRVLLQEGWVYYSM